MQGGASRPALVFVATAALAAAAVALFEQSNSPGFDGRRYLAMAHDPGAHVQAPYVTRVLAPLVVWALPLDERAGFRVLTVLSFAIAATLLYLLLVTWGASPRVGLGGVAVFLAATSTANMRDPFLIDGFSYCFIVGVLLALARRRPWLVVPLLVAAVFARDAIVVLVVPALVVYGIRTSAARLPLLIAAAAAVVAWLILTHTSLVLGFSRRTLDMVLDYERALGPLPKVAYRAFVFSFGALWLLPLVRAPAMRHRHWAVAAALCGLAAVVLAPSVTDWTRALSYAFPAVLAGLVLMARDEALGLILTLALSVAIANYGVQYAGGGALRYGLTVGILAIEGAVLFALARRPGRQMTAAREGTEATEGTA
jgi:hypothetical protein